MSGILENWLKKECCRVKLQKNLSETTLNKFCKN